VNNLTRGRKLLWLAWRTLPT